MDVIYVIYFFRGYYVIFLKSGVISLYFSVKRKIYAGDPPRVQWVGLGWGGLRAPGRSAMTRSRNCSLAPNISLRTLTSHQKELYQVQVTITIL